MFVPIFLELIARICFTSVSIVNKFSRKAGASTTGVMAQTVWAIPLFAVIGAVLVYNDHSSFIFPAIYWYKLFAWLCLCLLANYVLVFLSRYQALTELNGYRRGLSMVASIIIDYFWYGVSSWSLLYCLGGILAIAGGVLLSTRPITAQEADVRVPAPFPLWQSIILLILLMWISPVGYAFFKDCLILSGDQPLRHTVIGNTILFATFWFIGSKDYKTARISGALPNSRIIIAVTCVMVAAIAQTYSIAALSITTLMILGFVGVAMVTLSDILSGEVTPNKRNLASIGLIFLGGIIIGLSN